MDAPELKPCPFCGGEAVETRPSDVHCKDSTCAGYKTRHLSAERWNTRADIPAARIAELEAEVERLREALTPSSHTKAAYMGEVECDCPTETWRHNVPWSAIKMIMAMIRARAALAKDTTP